MTADSGVEIELIFLLTATAARRLVENLIGSAPPIEMLAIYYDTPDLAFRAAGYTLRIRREGVRWVQTLKSGSAGALARGEFERELSEGRLDLGLLDTAGLAPALLARRADLRPMFETHVKRRPARVTIDGAVIEVVLDEGEVVAGARRAALLEAELELKAGGRSALFRYARQLAGQGGLSLTFSNKSDRGFALAAGTQDGPVPYAPPSAARLARIGDAIGALGGAALHQLGGNLERLQAAPRHGTLRQAIEGGERLRALLRSIGGDASADAAAVDLDWLLGRLDEARRVDLFVANGFLPHAGWTNDRDAMAAFGRSFRAARRAAYRNVQAVAGSERTSKLMLQIAEVVGAPSTPPIATSLDQPTSDLAREVLSAQRVALDDAMERFEVTDPATRDLLRRQARTLVYLLDTLELLAPRRSGRRMDWSRALGRLVEHLDDLHEVDMARSVANLGLKGVHAEDEAFALRVLLASGGLVLARLNRSKNTAQAAVKALSLAKTRLKPAFRA